MLNIISDKYKNTHAHETQNGRIQQFCTLKKKKEESLSKWN